MQRHFMGEGQNDKRYYELAEKWANGSITPEEMKEYADWYNAFNAEDVLNVPPEYVPDKETHRHRILERIRGEINIRSKSNKGKILTRISVAASVLILAGAALYFRHATDRSKMQNKASLVSADKAPGHAGAILTLADGRQISLDTVKNGRLPDNASGTLIKDSGVLTYQNVDTSDQAASVAYNTMTTPRGRVYKIILPDGSNVWLNAASSINFPTAFRGKTREVTISGEVYFEVVHDAEQPFIVNAGSTKVTVLGTHFEVANYNDEKTIRTTLLQGSVKVTHKGQNVKIVPGQQAVVSGDDNIAVKEVDADDVTAWVRGNLSMENVNTAELLRQISRWYDVDIEVRGVLPDKHFFGMIDRNAAYLSQILDVLRENGLKITEENNKIIISAK